MVSGAISRLQERPLSQLGQQEAQHGARSRVAVQENLGFQRALGLHGTQCAGLLGLRKLAGIQGLRVYGFRGVEGKPQTLNLIGPKLDICNSHQKRQNAVAPAPLQPGIISTKTLTP